MMKAIDISTWQRNIGFEKVKAAGISAVIIRAGFGREISQKDSQFENHYKGARAAGLYIGAYWYSYAMSVEEARKEAQACLSCIKGKSFDLPIYFDMEEYSQTALGKKTLTNMADAFCAEIIGGGYRAGVYSNLNWLTNYLDYSALKARYSIWLAQWSAAHTLSCDIWQYSEDGTVPGISGKVDMNIIENPSVIGTGEKLEPNYLRFYTCAKSGYKNSIAQVKTIQRLLNWLGYRDQSGKVLKVNGQFDAATDYAVREYQRKHDLVADGIVGELTWKRLTAGK